MTGYHIAFNARPINSIMCLSPYRGIAANPVTLACSRPRVWLYVVVLLLFGCTDRGANLTLEKVTSAEILVQVAQHKGQEAVLVNFWATWCAPCVEEFPLIVELSRAWRDRGLKIYFVSVDWLDQVDQVRTFLSQQGVSGLNFIKDEKDNPFIDGITEVWTGAIPFTIVYGKHTGEIVDSWEGKADREKFEAAIQAALSG
jgi:thiol-disulfide isomerase/thioredoxin